MRTIKLGNREINIEGSAMTPYFYKKEFKQSFSGDLIKLQLLEIDNSLIDDINVLQMIWAMEKTSDTTKPMKGFETWLSELGPINIINIIKDIAEVAADAVFHRSETSK